MELMFLFLVEEVCAAHAKKSNRRNVKMEVNYALTDREVDEGY